MCYKDGEYWNLENYHCLTKGILSDTYLEILRNSILHISKIPNNQDL